MLKKKKEYLILIVILIFFFILFLSRNLTCIFYDITGLYCPGCGITRMFLALSKLDFYQAFRYNSLVFCLLLFALMYIFYYLGCYKKVKKLNSKATIVLIIIVILFGILRNIPYFEFLAPTVV